MTVRRLRMAVLAPCKPAATATSTAARANGNQAGIVQCCAAFWADT
jgi:hypothetical protein